MGCRKRKNIITLSGLDEYDTKLKKTYEKKLKCCLLVGVVSVMIALIACFWYFDLKKEWERELEEKVIISNTVVEDKRSFIVRDGTNYLLYCKCDDGRQLKVSTSHNVKVGDPILVYEYQGICATSKYSILSDLTSSESTLVLFIVAGVFCIVLVCISKYKAYKKSLHELMQKVKTRIVLL